MEKRTFGKTGKQVSILGFGCMRLPLNGPDASCVDLELSTAMIRKAVDGGVNYIDTAWPYHSTGGFGQPGASEPAVAHALRNGYREKAYIATKLPVWAITCRADMDRILDAQLERLETDHIDFYLVHSLKAPVWAAMQNYGVTDFLDSALKDGRIRHAGFSFHDRFEVFKKIVDDYDWEFAQIQYNYLDVQYQAGVEGLKLAAQKGLGLVIMEPLRGGFLVNHLPQEMREVLRDERPDWTPADWGLRWIWNQPEAHVVLSGMSTMQHVDENLRSAATAHAGSFSPGELATVDQVRAFFAKRIKVDCTACGYCLPCPEGVNIPNNFSLYNDYFLIDGQEARDRTRYFYKALLTEAERADKCAHCGECETKCPQSLPISKTMEEIAALLCG